MTTKVPVFNLEEVAARAAKWPLECDGTTRCLAALMVRHNQACSVACGQLDVHGLGYIAPHWWLELPDGRLFDVKARMWLDDDQRAPHGIFKPGPDFCYRKLSEEKVETWATTNMLFNILTGEDIQSFDSLFGL